MVEKGALYDPQRNIFSNDKKAFFNADDLIKPKNEYIAWVDLMGTKSWLLRSINHAANHIFKLHASLTVSLDSLDFLDTDDVRVYPAMDGFFLTCGEKVEMLHALEEVFATMSRTVIDRLAGNWGNIRYMPIIRGAVAYGPVIHGGDLHNGDGEHQPLDFSLADDDSKIDQSGLVLGDPISQAFSQEDNAPPYGLYVCESARGFAEGDTQPFDRVWLDWFHPHFGEKDYQEIAGVLRDLLTRYYTWCEMNSGRIRYPEDRRKEHKDWMEQYLPEPDYNWEQNKN